MARRFIAANQNRLANAVIPNVSPFTWACWFQPDGTSTETMVSTGVITTAWQYRALWCDNSGLNMGAVASILNIQNATSLTAPIANAWNHGVGIEAATNDRRVYLNNVRGTDNLNNASPNIPTWTGLGVTVRNPLDFFLNGLLGEVIIWDAALNDKEVSALYHGERPYNIRPANLLRWWPLAEPDGDAQDYSGRKEWLGEGGTSTIPFERHPPVPPQWGGAVYFPVPAAPPQEFVIDAEAGAYAKTGTDAALVRELQIAAEAGGYNQTGAEAALLLDAVVDADAGAYTILGSDVGLERQFTLALDPGAYAKTGTDVTFEIERAVMADTGAYGLTGTPATLARDYIFDADPGAYAKTGTVAGLFRDLLVNADVGAYGLTGTDVTFLIDYVLAADTGIYTWTGAPVDFNEAFVMMAEAGAYDWIGTDVALLKDYIFDVNTGLYVYQGKAADLRYSEEVEGPRGVIVRPQPPKPNDDRDMQDFLFLLNQILGRDR